MSKSRFQYVINKMPKYMEELEDCEPIPMLYTPSEWKKLGFNVPKKGIYVLYEEEKPMYVGRSDNIPGRLQQHGRSSSTSSSASFAFNLAKRKFSCRTSIPKEEFELWSKHLFGDVSRSELEKNDIFQPYFNRAKESVKKMKVRVVEVEDPIEQTIFEVYAHMELGTEFNSFENH